MKIRVSLIVLLALVAALLLLSGAGRAVSAAAPAVLIDEPAAGESQTPAAGESPPAAAGELEEFIPSERVPADSAISFPVDI